jgi:hypothetical protein
MVGLLYIEMYYLYHMELASTFYTRKQKMGNQLVGLLISVT